MYMNFWSRQNFPMAVEIRIGSAWAVLGTGLGLTGLVRGSPG